jgi:hypothetical protein
MTQRERDDNVPGLDALRKTYRAAGFEDEPPPHVDAFVRAAAKRADRRRFRAYLPPLAMAATIVLGLGLVLRLTTLGPELTEQPREVIEQLAPRATEPAATEEELGPDLSPSAGTSFAPAADSAAPLRSFREQPEPAQEGVASAAPEEPVAADRDSPARPSAAPADDVRALSEQQAQVEGSAAFNEVTVQARVIPSCADPRREGPEAWLACIEAAVDAGALDAARAELDAFRREFPDHAVPEPLATALAL